MRYKYPWFRWAMSQPRTLLFMMLAKKSGMRAGDIKLVYLNLCEHAACNDPRGSVEGFDFDGSDCVWDLEEGTSRKVYDLLRQRHVIDEDDRLVGWNEEQGEAEEQTREERKREQTAERVRRLREKAKSEGTAADASADKQEPLADPSSSVTQCNAVTHCNAGDALHVTQCNAVTHRDNRDKIKEIKDLKYTPLTPQGEQGVGVSTPAQTSPLKAREAPGPDPEPKPETPATDPPQAPDTTTDPATPPQADTTHGNPAWKEFCYVFSLWPVQQGKEKAWREYAYLKARHIVPESYALADIIERFKAEDRRWKRGYIPMMSNWLHDRRWDDVPEKAPAKSYAPDENGSTPYVDEHDQDYTSSGFGSIFDSLKEKANA